FVAVASQAVGARRVERDQDQIGPGPGALLVAAATEGQEQAGRQHGDPGERAPRAQIEAAAKERDAHGHDAASTDRSRSGTSSSPRAWRSRWRTRSRNASVLCALT